jgi:hypothetical protein
VGVAGRPNRDTLAERPAVTAVQEQHHVPGPGRIHAAPNEIRGHRRGPESIRAGVRGREKQLARLALQAVTGEVQQQYVVRPSLGEQVVDLPLHDVRRFIGDDIDLAEAAYLRITEHAAERLSVGGRRGETTESGVVVLVVGDDQRGAHP